MSVCEAVFIALGVIVGVAVVLEQYRNDHPRRE